MLNFISSTPTASNSKTDKFEKVQSEGFDPKYFVSEVNSDFLCPLCNFVVRKPKECTVCGNIFCDSCIRQWADKQNKIISNQTYNITLRTKSLTNNYNDIPSNEIIILECPMKCKSNTNIKESIMKPIGKVIKNLLYQLEIKCPNKSCESIFPLDKYEEHEGYCFLPKCENKLCKQGSINPILYKNELSNEDLLFCKDLCKFNFIFQEKAYEFSNLNKNEFCIWFHKFIKTEISDSIHQECLKRIINLKSMVKAVCGNTVMINDIDYNSGITIFKWDGSKKGQGIQIFNDGQGLLLYESCYAFRTIIGNIPFESGVHYWEIIADRKTENELKVGITKNINFNYDTSFSDYSFGYAFYGIGQIRHANNATGGGYGKQFKKSGVLGVFLDMNRGILSFALDGEYFGRAFQSEDLKIGPIWPAISLLHVAGCMLQTGIPSPPYFFSDY